MDQKRLLYEIAKLHSEQFYNAMNDHWTLADGDFDRECEQRIKSLEAEYKLLYGDLPEWKYIDDVWKTQAELKELLCDGGEPSD